VRTVRLGSEGLEVSAIGYGAWGLSGDYGPAEDTESIRTLRRAVELGVTLIDTADEYGAGHNEDLIRRALGDLRGQIVLSTKVGLVREPGDGYRVCGRPEYLGKAVERSLRRLGVDHVDLLTLHRADPAVPIEESVGAMADLVQAGRARHLGLSEVTAALVRRAHAVHAITAVQSEYSLWTRDPEDSVLPALRELGIGFVAFSPLGRGFLAAAVRREEELAASDFRRGLPRFRRENLTRNLGLLDVLRAASAKLGATPAQVALAWLLTKGVVPIPGTRTREHLEANVRAASIVIPPSTLAELETAFPPGVAAGERYPASMTVLAQPAVPVPDTKEPV
jgi:aryl-alcohol dehydrogenase-like predicted oxidoreductase